MNSEKRKEPFKIIPSTIAKQFASELSSFESPQVKSKPSKKAELEFIKKLKSYRKNYRYLT